MHCRFKSVLRCYQAPLHKPSIHIFLYVSSN